jgi:hypothetical protein
MHFVWRRRVKKLMDLVAYDKCVTHLSWRQQKEVLTSEDFPRNTITCLLGGS